MALIKKLTKHGNSYSIIIDRALMELLDIDADTPLEISTSDGHSLTITPIREEIRKDFIKKQLKDFNRKYGRALKRLA